MLQRSALPGGGAIDISDQEAAKVGERVRAIGGRWLFGMAELRESDTRLTVAGRIHELDRSSHELLRCLLRNAGNLVLKDTLIQAGWPGRMVSENSLTKAISRLRQALDDADGELLCTVHGYGYRLAARVQYIAEGEPEAPASSAALTPEHGSPILTATALPSLPLPDPTRARLVWLAVSLLLLAVFSAWYWRPPAPAQVRPQAPVTASFSSIAVLPFADMSQARDQQYFSDGLADELLDQLAKLPQLRVAGRTSSFSFRGKDDDVASIGRKLNVDTVLEGSVRKWGDRIRITVQLINVADGFHLWSETYDRKLTDLFAVQDDIARSVVATLRLQLLPGQREAVTRHRTSSPEAYRQFLLGRDLRHSSSPDDDRRAISAYQRAIVLDPKFATAYAALADVLGGDADYADTPAEVTAGKMKSLAMMDKAIELDPTLARTYVARADILLSTRWDWAGAQRDLDKAAALEPGVDFGRMVNQCRLLAALDRLPEAIALERRIVQVYPTSSAWGMLGYHYAVTGHYPQARQALAQAYALYPSDNRVNFYIGLTSLLQGDAEAAVRQFDRSGGGFRLAGLAMAQHSAGRAGQSQQALDTLILKAATTSAYQIVEVYAWRGEIDQAFAWMDRAHAQHDAGLIYIKFDPLLGSLRADQRYQAWLKKMRFPAQPPKRSTLAAS